MENSATDNKSDWRDKVSDFSQPPQTNHPVTEQTIRHRAVIACAILAVVALILMRNLFFDNCGMSGCSMASGITAFFAALFGTGFVIFFTFSTGSKALKHHVVTSKSTRVLLLTPMFIAILPPAMLMFEAVSRGILADILPGGKIWGIIGFGIYILVGSVIASIVVILWNINLKKVSQPPKTS